MRRWLLSAALILLLSTGLSAQPPAAAGNSTAQEGQLLPGPFRVFAVTGERAQYFHCFFCQHGLSPSVAVIATQLPANPQDPLAVLLQKLNALDAANADAKLGTFGIFLTLEKEFYEDPNRTQRLAELEGLSKQMNLTELAVGLSHPEAQPVKQYGIITRDDPVNNIKRHQATVLVYDKHRVLKRFTFTEDKPLTEESMKQIFSAVEGILPASK